MSEFVAVITSYLFAVYFSLFGFVLLLMVAAQHGKSPPLASIAVMILGFCIILIGRFYMVQTVKTKLKLTDLWMHYPKNRGVAVSAILVFTGVMVSLALWMST
jgi:surface polysaccharide O-acyltransferase-like enzyme